MNLENRIFAFSKLGDLIKSIIDDKKEIIISKKTILIDELYQSIFIENGWFDKVNVKHRLTQISQSLQLDNLINWCNKYDFKKNKKVKSIVVIAAGNISFVSFHDVLCVLITGNHLKLKLSHKDQILPKFILKLLCEIEPKFLNKIEIITGKLENYNAIIATGNNNTSIYFQYYFKKIPNIIRKNRTSIAIFNGNETQDELKKIGDDLFLYYGLGCRNISKIYLSKEFDIQNIFKNIIDWGYIVENKKYFNNYEYQKTIFMIDKIKFLENNFIIFKEDKEIHSPIGVIHYEYYDSKNEIKQIINNHKSDIQCIVGKEYVGFGNSQKLNLEEYSDNVDTIDFLNKLN